MYQETRTRRGPLARSRRAQAGETQVSFDMAPTGDQIVRVARKAAGLVLLSGGETYRAEETARHIAEAFGWHMDIIAFPTGLTMTVTRGEESASSIMRISDRTTDLSRLERVNAISRAVSDRKMTLDHT